MAGGLGGGRQRGGEVTAGVGQAGFVRKKTREVLAKIKGELTVLRTLPPHGRQLQ